MTFPVDKKSALGLEQALRFAAPQLQLRAVADEQPRTARLQGGGFDKLPTAVAGDTFVAPHRSVSQILRTSKIAALGRMIRDQACEEQGARVGQAAVGIALDRVLPGKAGLEGLYFWFDPKEGRPKVGHVDRQEGVFVQNTGAESRTVDTHELERALQRLIGEIAKTDRLASIPIKTAPQFLSN